MISEHRSLLMRSNRLLGAQLVEHNLVKIDDLESANERLLELLGAGDMRQATILGILAYEKKVLREEDVLLHTAESENVALLDLRHYEVNEDVKKVIEPGACWATWSLPFDREEDMTFVATAYWLSPAVRSYWEKQFEGRVLWYGTTLEAVADFLEKLEQERAGAPATPAGI